MDDQRLLGRRPGEVVTGTIDDVTGSILNGLDRPGKVAWGMARGGNGAFGGTMINSYPVWLTFCAVFLLGLVDWRRPFSLRTLDLLMLLSFSVSLWFFNRGNIFAAMPLIYPGLVWLLARSLWIGRTGRAPRGSSVLAGVGARRCDRLPARISRNPQCRALERDRRRTFRGHRCAADRHGAGALRKLPDRGHPAPVRARPMRPPVRSATASRTNGRCEAADAQGDTYGPVSYAGLPAGLPRVRLERCLGLAPGGTSQPPSSGDSLCLVGLWLVGRRFGGSTLAATLAFAWAAWPFSQYASNSNTNDMIQPALLIFGFYFLSSPALRGAFGMLGALVKFSPLVLLPLWSGYPDSHDNRSRLRFPGRRRPRRRRRRVLHPAPRRRAGAGGDRLLPTTPSGTSSRRRSAPFSIWDWRQYHAKEGFRIFTGSRTSCRALLVQVGALALYAAGRATVRRCKSPRTRPRS